MSTSSRMDTRAFFDRRTSTWTHVVADRSTRRAAIIDPVLDYDRNSGHVGHHSAQAVVDHLRAEGLELEWILETHVHADHLSAARWLQQRLGGRIGIGEQVLAVQRVFKKLYGLGPDFAADGTPFDHRFTDGERFRIGELQAEVLHVPGHTPADVAYRIEGELFVGDTLFMPDVGTARADFPGGDARMLYRSIRRLLAEPPATPIHLCHDYPPAGRAPCSRTTVADQRASNIHVRDGVDEDAFVALRQARDATLDAPDLLLPSLQVNVRAGDLPPPEADGVSYLRIPLNALPVLKPPFGG